MMYFDVESWVFRKWSSLQVLDLKKMGFKLCTSSFRVADVLNLYAETISENISELLLKFLFCFGSENGF